VGVAADAQISLILVELLYRLGNIQRAELELSRAEALGAEMEFGAKYPEMVSVYMIGGTDASAFSKEFCGGPHVGNTSELGAFKIQKEEAVSQGVRRIKAVLS
jgi:alanyl-tRNA synthetase